MEPEKEIEEPGAEAELLSKADALIARHRGRPPQLPSADPTKAGAANTKLLVPVLTEVVDVPSPSEILDAIPLLTEVFEEAFAASPLPAPEPLRQAAPAPAVPSAAAEPGLDRDALAKEVFEDALRRLESRIEETIEQRLSPHLVGLLANTLDSLLGEVKADLAALARESVAQALQSRPQAAAVLQPAGD